MRERCARTGTSTTSRRWKHGDELGHEPEVEGEAHFDILIEILVAALCARDANWEHWRYHAAMWSIDGEQKGSATRWQKNTLDALREISNNKSELLAHVLTQPSFLATMVVNWRNARDREPSTSASSSGSQPATVCATSFHVPIAKELLVQIAKEFPPTKEGAVPYPHPTLPTKRRV